MSAPAERSTYYPPAAPERRGLLSRVGGWFVKAGVLVVFLLFGGFLVLVVGAFAYVIVGGLLHPMATADHWWNEPIWTRATAPSWSG